MTYIKVRILGRRQITPPQPQQISYFLTLKLLLAHIEPETAENSRLASRKAAAANNADRNHQKRRCWAPSVCNRTSKIAIQVYIWIQEFLANPCIVKKKKGGGWLLLKAVICVYYLTIFSYSSIKWGLFLSPLDRWENRSPEWSHSYSVGDWWPEMMTFDPTPSLITTYTLMGLSVSSWSVSTQGFHCET